MKKSILKIKEIVIEEKLYPRVKPNDRIINAYVKDMKKGDSFPSLFIGLFKGKNYLIDGRHRLEAYKILGEKYVNCEIKPNFTDFDDMFLAAFRANMAHGIRLNKNDKLRVANILTNMQYDVGDISKLTGITMKKIESAVKGKIRHVLIKDKIRSGEFPEIIKEKIQGIESIKLIDDEEVQRIEKSIRENVPEIKEETKLFDNKEITRLEKSIKEKIPETKIVKDREIKKIEEANKEEFQLYQLNEIYNYIKSEDFDLQNIKMENLLKRIKKLLHKRFPKL